MVRVPLVVREDLQGGTRRGLLSVFLHKKYIHSCSFHLSGSVNKFLNFCVAYFPCCFLKTAIKISHSHFVHAAFVSILVFQTFDRLIFGTLNFSGTRWYMMTVRDTQMVRDQKKFENHWPNGWRPGPGKVGQSGLKVLHLWRHSQPTRTPQEKNFFRVQSTRLAACFQSFAESLEQTGAEIFIRKATCV